MSLTSRIRRRTATALAGVAAIGLLATGCSSGGSGGGADASTLIAYTGQAGDYQINFNPFSPTKIGGLGTIYEPLFFFNKAQVSDPVPLLGTEQSWNEDGTELSVTLREGVKWSDGEALHRRRRRVHVRDAQGDPGDQQHRLRRRGRRRRRHARHVHVRGPRVRQGPGPAGHPDRARAPLEGRQPRGGRQRGARRHRRLHARRVQAAGVHLEVQPRLLGRRAEGEADPLPRAVGQPGRRGRDRRGHHRLADRPDPGHPEHQQELPELRRLHAVAEPDGPRHLLQRRAGLRRAADRSGRAPRPLLRDGPHADQQPRVHGHRQRRCRRRSRSPRARTTTSRPRWKSRPCPKSPTPPKRPRSSRAPAGSRATTASTPRTASASR